jgi:hypothetical protein
MNRVAPPGRQLSDSDENPFTHLRELGRQLPPHMP